MYDCTFAGLRKREDPWNAIAAGAATGGTLAIRAGMKAIGTNAAIGGILLAMIEGLGVLIGKMSGANVPQQQPQLLAPPQLLMGHQPVGASSSSLPLPPPSTSFDSYQISPTDNSFSTEDFSFNDQYDFADE
jgi:hypothetical protein